MWEKKLLIALIIIGFTGLLSMASPYWSRDGYSYGLSAQWVSFFKGYYKTGRFGSNYYRYRSAPTNRTTVFSPSPQSNVNILPSIIPSPSSQPQKTANLTLTPSPTPIPSVAIKTPVPLITTAPTQIKTPTPTPKTLPITTSTPVSTVKPIPNTTPIATPIPTSPATPLMIAINPHIQWGAYSGNSPVNGDEFEALTGKKMTYQAIFVGWGINGSFPKYFAPLLIDRGRTLVIFWEPYGTTLDAIINGSWDSYLTQFASDAINYRGPIILAPLHEMNGNWDPWGGTINGNTPEKVVSAWRHIHSFFNQATNVKFGWAPNNESVPNTPVNQLENYYPGDAYVDFVGVDGFNFGNPWQSFAEVFGPALEKLKAYPKPAIIFSMASAQGDQKDEWISQGLGFDLLKYPQVIGWIWFNQNKEKDWRVDSSTDALSSFKSVLP